jgi:hypothetical protein
LGKLLIRSILFPTELYQRCRSAGNSAPAHAALAGLLAAGIYLRTLTPSIAWGDSPELVAAAYQLGVPHPTGYPLYMLLGHAAIRLLPWGDPAYRMNLLSALLASGAVAAMHRVAQRLTGSLAAGWVGAILLALAPLFWSQAVIAEVYPLAQLLALLLIYFVVRWDQTGSLRDLQLAAFLTGLNIAHHTGISLLAPGLVGFALTSAHARAGLRRLPRLLGLLLLPLLLYLYLPIRAAADPWLNWGDTRTLGAALYHISGRFYREMMFATPGDQVRIRVHDLWWLLVANLGWTGALLAIAGGLSTLWRSLCLLAAALLRRSIRPSPAFLTAAWNGWRLAWLLGTWIVLAVLWAVHYWIFDYEVFYLPALLALCLLAGIGAGALGDLVHRTLSRGQLGEARAAPPTPREGLLPAGGEAAKPPPVSGEAAGRASEVEAPQGRPAPALPSPRRCPGIGSALFWTVVIGLVLYPVVPRWSANDRHDDWSALRYARAVAQLLPRHALVFGMGDYQWFPLIYVLAVERSRPDVLVFNLWETTRPPSYRLFARYRSRDFAVLPVPGFGVEGRQRTEYDFLRSLVEGNVGRRPVCFLMERSVLEGDEIRLILSPYYLVARSNLPLRECYPVPPAYRPTPLPAPHPPLHFEDGTRLLGFSATYSEEAGVQWVRLTYHWEVAYRSPLDHLQARVWFSDRQGGFQTRPGGLPELENVHGLDYGYLPQVVAPFQFGEEYWVFVPQNAARQTYQVRLQLERNGIPVRNTRGQQVTILGEVRIPPAPTPPVIR